MFVTSVSVVFVLFLLDINVLVSASFTLIYISFDAELPSSDIALTLNLKTPPLFLLMSNLGETAKGIDIPSIGFGISKMCFMIGHWILTPWNNGFKSTLTLFPPLTFILTLPDVA